MDPLSLTSSLISLLSVWQGALKGASVPTLRGHAALVRDYSFSMSILEDCVRDIRTAGEEVLTPAIVEATRHCVQLGQDLASRQERFVDSSARKIIAYVLAPWEKLQAQYKEFGDSVTLIHNLTQGLILRKLHHDQEKLLMRSFEHESLMRMIVDEYTRRKSRLWNRNPGDLESMASGAGSFTTDRESLADIVTLADEVVTKSMARGTNFDNNPSMVLGTITVTHESKPRFVPVRAKYDTGADANFIPSAFVKAHGLSSLLEELLEDGSHSNLFIGLNNEEFYIQHTITLQWCASTMHRVRTTKFHVADDLPYDMLLGDPFIQENRIFDPQRVALPLRRRRRNSAQRAEEELLNAANEAKEAEELQRTRLEDKRQRDLMREANRLGRSHTSASSMISASPSHLYPDTATPRTTASSGSPLNSPDSS
ncbi:hypothetical protein K431DRAFT_290929 [Polychaeton citri CBS 116435]|uniref:Peptidase A2 domain-containing protein n=1 Tax=Polychaeton citri CBS 116435 TaxID=1314669 RepID=A0A9P4UR53_9PEZI|nr:hypothetical protein K431DRAFT_290929 [Polychaeton citri CBS 116435]